MARRPPVRPQASAPAPSGRRGRGFTRALKNARFLKRAAPEVFDKDPRAPGFGTGVPLEILRQLHRLAHHSPLLKRHPAVVEFLKSHRLPVPTRGARDALFSGTVYFAQVTFNTSGGSLVVPTADMNTIVQYARHAIVPISEYAAAQYGPNTMAVSPTLLTYTASVPSGSFTDADLQGWVNDMATTNGLPASSCIYVVCPTGISANEVGGNAGYHNLANIPYIVAGVYATGLTLQDEPDVYAMVVSHEMAEMVVDPKVDGQNPEVCDPCDINCSNLTRVYFDLDDNFLGVNQLSPPGGFAFAYYICAVVKAEGAANCPASGADCQYAPVTQSLEFVMGQSTYSKDESNSTPSFAPAFWLRVSGFTNEALGLTSPGDLANATPSPAPTISASVDTTLNLPNNISVAQLAVINASLPSPNNFGPPPIVPADPTLQQDPQSFLYPYTLTFTSQAAFGVLQPDQAVFITLNASLTVGQITVTASANITLTAGEDPRFEDVDPNNPQGYPTWLSFDLRFLKMTVPTSGAVQTASRFGATMTTNPADAPGFIASVVARLTAGNGTVNGDTFDPGLSQDEDASALEYLPNDSAGNLVFNFAVARVRLKGNTPNAKAKKVRVFFRLFQAQSTVSDFNTSTTYRFFSDGQLNGVTAPLLGVQNDSSGNPDYVTIPCFATPRVCIDPATNGYVAVSMTTQPEDTPNAQEIDVVPGVEVDTFFGCWLDINQPNQKFLPATLSAGHLDGPYSGALFSINEVIANAAHQCLIAEIRDDDTPIPPGATTSNSDKLAQRNIAWIDGPNPGTFDSRRNPHPFEIRATPIGAAAPDELMIFWGNTPSGSRASVFLPTVEAADILALADAYPFHQLKRIDAHTLQCPTGGATFIPIPTGTVRNAGLLTVDLPAGVKRGERYDVVVRQTTLRTVTITPPPPPPPIQRGGGAPAAPATETVSYSWREILGAFQVSIVISTKEELLVPEERLLAWLRWKLKVLPTRSRWYPVLQRYVDQVSGRVEGFGGDPATIQPSPTGDLPKPGPHPGPHHEERRQFTGKVVGIVYDRFGDFVGFLLITEAGREHRFEGREPAVRELVHRAWAERTLITVFVDDEKPDWPTSIVLRRTTD